MINRTIEDLIQLDEKLPSKRYEPPTIELDNKNNSHTLLIESTGFNKTILEIGTSTGYISKILKEHGNHVTGIEIDQDAASIAQQFCDHMITADIELLNLDEILETASFDVILCGDVLEHLKEPEIVLKKLGKFLKHGGYIAVSLPNFFHGDVLLNLLNGDFHYTSVGLLDETHLRFFGLKNIHAFFTRCGYQITNLQKTNRAMGTTELKTEATKIPRDLVKFIKSLPDSTVYQYILTAYPSDNIIQPAFEETDISTLFFDALQEYRQELKFPLETRIAELEKNLKDKTTCIEELVLTLTSGNEQVVMMTENIAKLHDVLSIEPEKQQCKEISVQAEGLDEKLAEKNQQIKEITVKAQELAQENKIKGHQVQEQMLRINSLEQEIFSIENSIVWQLTMKFHTKIVERLLPQKTKRRKYYDLGRTCGKILVHDGIKPFNKYVTRYFHRNNGSDDYQKWIKKNEPMPDALNHLKKIAQTFSFRPKISIIIPVWNTDKKWLHFAIESVVNQVYDNWELCIVDGGSSKRYIKQVLTEYAQKDIRIKVKFLAVNKGIAENSNEALALATGDFIGFLDHDDELAPFALYEVVDVLNRKNNFDFIYSDEDKIDQKGNRKDPFFKPDWSPDLLLSQNYICHFSVIRKSLINLIGGFRSGYDGSQDYDLFLRCTERISPVSIAHIPKILYHWRIIRGSAADSVIAKPYAIAAAKKALADFLNRKGQLGEVFDGFSLSSYRIRYSIKSHPRVSIVIPTKDHVEILKRCVRSILDKTRYQNYEIVIVDNQSREDDTFDYYNSLNTDPKIRILHYDKQFNFSAINNYAVTQVDSPYILFLNNDTEVISGEWLSAMLEHAQRDGIGTVGAKLLYPNNLIQHAGVIMGITGTPGQKGVAGHSHKNLPANCNGYFLRSQIIGNYSAVTAACLMMRKNVFQEIGGFNEDLAIAFNDVDLCLKIRSAGYLIIYTPYSQLYHHESVSRGYENTPEKQARFSKEVRLIRDRWGTVIDSGDPYYSPNLTLEREDFSIKQNNEAF